MAAHDVKKLRGLLAEAVAIVLDPMSPWLAKQLHLTTITGRLNHPRGGQPKDARGGARTGLREEARHREPCRPGRPQAFEGMPVERLLRYCDGHARDLQTCDAMAMVQRLYDLALFEHHIPEELRKQGLQWIKLLKDDIISSSFDDNGLIISFNQDCALTIESAQLIGRGSLLWKLVEDCVPDDYVIEYIMRPEHRSCLDNYFTITRRKLIVNSKPKIIEHLVKQRLIPGVLDPVITLHALATQGDEAVAAVFDADEIDAFVNVPDDYDAARLALEQAGLQLGPNPMAKIKNPRRVHAIPELVNQMIVRTNEKDGNDGRLMSFPIETGDAVRWILTTLRYSLVCRILTQSYGMSIKKEFLRLLDEKLQSDIERFTAQEATFAELKPAPSINYHLVVKSTESYCSENTVTLQHEKTKCISAWSELISTERAKFINQVHKFLQRAEVRILGRLPKYEIESTNR
jgi:hypothetical protein